MKKVLKKGLILLVLPLLAFATAHKFYVSVTHINYSKDDNALQVTSRIFIDDFEQLIQERYDVTASLGTDNESELSEMYIEKYFKSKFKLKSNGQLLDYTFIGKKYDNDIIVCFIEVPNINLSTLESIEIENGLFTDLYEEQQNIVHFKINNKKKSFVLIRESNKGLLKL